MSRGSSSERSSVRDIVLPVPSERVSFFSGSAAARLSERVTSCARSAAAASVASASVCAVSAADGRGGGGGAAVGTAEVGDARRRAAVPPSALSDERATADREPGGDHRHGRQRQRRLQGRLGRASSVRRRGAYRPAWLGDDTSGGPDFRG